MTIHSIRWKLSLSFAGIALLTTLALGVALLVPLRAYYQKHELAYLKGNAESIAAGLTPLFEMGAPEPEALSLHIRFLSFLSQVRVRLEDLQGNQLADSGSPQLGNALQMAAVPGVTTAFMGENIQAGGETGFVSGDLVMRIRQSPTGVMYEKVIVPEEGTPGTPAPMFPPIPAGSGVRPPQEGVRFYSTVVEGVAESAVPAEPSLVSVVPLSNTMYGFELFERAADPTARSEQVYRQPVMSQDGDQLAWVELSEGPAYGREIVTNVARGWALASLVAVLVAASAGWWISHRMSAPVVALTSVTRRMAAGELSARADLTQHDEYGALGRAFNEMAGRVEATISTLRRFAADAAHELHTPLTALRTNLELAQTTPDPKAYLTRAVEQVQRLEHLTRDLLDLSRIEGGSPELAIGPVDLKTLVERTSEPYAAQAEQAGVDFRLSLPDEEAVVRGHENLLAQAICNLLDNAVKFTPASGWVAAGVAVMEGRAVVWVEDSGIGVDPEDIPALFQRFHRGRNASGYPGSGLGLSIVKAVAEAHGGDVLVESAEGRTRFSLCLPSAEV